MINPKLKFHKGFYVASEDLKQRMKILTKDCNTIILTGHSLGGAIAGILSILYQSEKKIKQLTTFGCPGYMHSSSLKIEHDQKFPIYHFLNKEDPVASGVFIYSRFLGETGHEVILSYMDSSIIPSLDTSVTSIMNSWKEGSYSEMAANAYSLIIRMKEAGSKMLIVHSMVGYINYLIKLSEKKCLSTQFSEELSSKLNLQKDFTMLDDARSLEQNLRLIDQSTTWILQPS
jgi:hypothetical protein